MKYGKDNPGKLTYASWTSVGDLARRGSNCGPAWR